MFFLEAQIDGCEGYELHWCSTVDSVAATFCIYSEGFMLPQECVERKACLILMLDILILLFKKQEVWE